MQKKKRGLLKLKERAPFMCVRSFESSAAASAPSARRRKLAFSVRYVRSGLQISIISDKTLALRVRWTRIALHLHLHTLRKILLQARPPEAAHTQHTRFQHCLQVAVSLSTGSDTPPYSAKLAADLNQIFDCAVPLPAKDLKLCLSES